MTMRRTILIIMLIPLIGLAFRVSAQAVDSEGIAYYKAGFPNAAKVLLLSELGTSPSDARVYYYLGGVYFNENKPDSASYYYKQGLALDAENPYCQIGLAQLLIKNDPDQAADQIKDVLKGKNKKNPDILIAAGRAFLNNGMPAEALAYQELAKKADAKYAPVYVFAGDIAFIKKNMGNSCSEYEQAIYFDPDCKEAYIKYAKAYIDVNPQLSVEILLKLKHLYPDFLPVEKELAAVYYSQGEYRNAIDAYEQFIHSNCASARDLTKYGMVLFLAKDYGKSLDLVNQALKRDPDNTILRRLAMYDNYELKEYSKGLQAAQTFFDKSVDSAYVYLDHLYYGRLLNVNKQSDKALEHYHKALDMESDKPEIWKELSEVHEKMSNYDAAIHDFNTYLKLIGKNADVSDLFLLGRLYYYAGSDITDSLPENVAKKKAVLASADSIFSIVEEKVPDNYLGYFWRARTNSLLDPETTAGLAKPHYESALAILENKPDAGKSLLIECNSYLGYYYFVKNNFTESKIYWNKILTIDPSNETAHKALRGIK